MLVTVEQFEHGIYNYIDQEIAKKATGANKFMIYFILPNMSAKIKNIITKSMDDDLTKNYFNENGHIKLDDLYVDAKTAIQKAGQFEMYGIIFNESDIDKLYHNIKQTSV